LFKWIILYLYLYHQQPQYGPHSVISQTLQAEIPELVPGLTYEFKVRARTRVGYGNYSSTVFINVTTPTTAPPTSATTGSPVGNVTEVVDSGVESTGTQIAVIVTAAIGWLILLGLIGVVVVVILLFYRHKKKQKERSYSPGMELHFRNPTTDDGNVHGNVYETIDKFLDSEDVKVEFSAGITPKLAAADEGNPNISIDSEDAKVSYLSI